MLKTLDLENCFTHKKLHLDFQSGMTAILGPNGSGKSLIMEMVQYALWGSSALRGKADDYKGLIVNLTFEVKGIEYSVRRAGSTVRLSANNQDLASGTKAVNPHIASLFGYSFEVFKMANAVNQGKIEELGEMLPTARKKLVDQTLGLDRLDTLSDWLADTAKGLRANITAAEKYLLAPIEPEEFHLKQSAAELKLQLESLQVQQRAYRELEAQTKVVWSAPVMVAAHERLGELFALEATQGTRLALLAQQRTIQQALASFPELGPQPEAHPEAEQLHELIVETEAFKESTAQKTQIETMLAGMPEPKYSKAMLEADEVARAMQARWATKQELLAELAEFVCPKCDHHWHTEDPRLKDYADVPDEKPTTKIPVHELQPTRNAWAKAGNRAELVAALALLEDRLKDKADWTATIRSITEAKTAQAVYAERVQQQGRRNDLQAQLNTLEIPVDQSGLITELKANQTVLESYRLDCVTYHERVRQQASAISALALLPSNLDTLVATTMTAWHSRGVYEHQLEAYATAKVRYDAQLAEVQRDKDELTQWDLCRQAVVTLRQRVKGFLLPSLNKVASGLLQTMTAGVLNWVVVSEDFDITVDGQRLETLSGAGKSVANLALRIGLGQVLTCKTFSVLLLDEIDASCDEARATAIAESLQRLTGQIGQIIQVSHKQGLVADHYVRL